MSTPLEEGKPSWPRRLFNPQRLLSLTPLLATISVIGIYVTLYSGFLQCKTDAAYASCNPLSDPTIFSKLKTNEEVRITSYVGESTWTLVNGVHVIISLAGIVIACAIIYRELSEYSERVRRHVLGLTVLIAANLGLLQAWMTVKDAGAPAPTLMKYTVARVLPDINNYNRLFDAVGIMAALVIAVAACAILWQRYVNKEPDEQELKRRAGWLRYVLYVGAAALVIAVLRIYIMLNWGVSYFPAASAEGKAVSELTTSIVTLLGTYFTTILAAIYIPPAILIRMKLLKIASVQSPQDPEDWLTKHGLTLSFVKYLPRLVAILSPFLVGPIGDLIGRLAQAAGSK